MAVRYLLNDRFRRALDLSAPGPVRNGKPKGRVTMRLSVKDRVVTLPDVTAKVYADDIARLVKKGTLVKPADPEPELKPIAKKSAKPDS